jgi:hypothetical protein
MPIIFLQIDFRKAYDKVFWGFMREFFTVMNFPSSFLLFLSAITRGSQSQVLINGSRGVPFDTTQLVRQGCPLSPILFNFAIHCLSSCIVAKRRAGNICGLYLPHIQMEYLQASYADDTHMVLDANPSNLHAAKRILDRFAIASGLSINWTKSEARWMADYPRPEETESLQWLWKLPTEPGTILGFSFTNRLESESMFEAL